MELISMRFLLFSYEISCFTTSLFSSSDIYASPFSTFPLKWPLIKGKQKEKEFLFLIIYLKEKKLRLPNKHACGIRILKKKA